MADIPLRTYVQQLDNLIERKNVDEAIAHSRHILTFYPKHLDTYRMLGKALLEKGRHGDAADVFQRVLSVLPDDFISHVGMAIVREDEANLDAALWHMERAFEAMPSNGAIQQELCRLYGRRDGIVPPKARLTRGALGRMYLQGGLYVQAEAELKAALADDPDRIDLQTILAQVYWYSEQPAAAAQLCGAIVQSLPYSQVGNRILREIFRSRGRDSDAILYRQRLEALDPYEGLAPPAGDGATLSTVEQVEADKVLVTRLEYVAGMEGTGGPDWIASIGARFEEPAGRGGETTPDWLNVSDEPAEAFDAADVPGTSGVPDWLSSGAPPVSEPAAAEAGPMPEWLSELSQAGAAGASAPVPDSDLPDWLKGAATGPLADEDVPAWMQTVGGSASTPVEATPIDETMPGWLAAAQTQAGQPQAAQPDWMSALDPTPSEANAQPSAAAVPLAAAGDLPDWLQAAAPAGGPADDDLPDWLKASTGTLPDPSTSHSPPAAPWLSGSEAETPSPTAEAAAPAWLSETPAPAPTAETPEWVPGDMPDAPAVPAMTFDTEQPAAGVPPAEAMPDWLTEMAASAPGEEVPAWMQAETPPAPEVPAAPEPSLMAVSVEQPDDSLAPAGDLTDWLAEISASAPAEDVPAWMQPETPAAPEPPTLAFEATQPAADLAPAEAAPDWLGAVPGTPATDDLPDWMKAIAEDPAPTSAEATLGQPEAAEAEPAPAAAEMPDWLQSLAPDAPAQAAPSPTAGTTPGAGEAAAEEAASDLPDWLQAATAASPSEEVPVWLQSPAADEAAPATPPDEPEIPAAAATPLEDLPEWLAAASAASPAEEAPAWMQTAPEPPTLAETVASTEAEAPSSPTEAMASGTPAADDLPDWLAAASAASPADEVPAWLQPSTAELDAALTAASSEAQMPGGLAEDAAPTPDADLPDWLRAMAADTEDNRTAHWEAMAEAEFGVEQPADWETGEIEETEQPLPEGIPGWMQTMAAAAPTPDSEPAQAEPEAEAPVPPSTPAVELPDFLQLASPEAIARAAEPFAVDGEPELTEAVAADADEGKPALAPGDMPDWLKALAPESPAASASVPGFDADIMAAAAAGLNLDEAPDWLKSAQPGGSPSAELPAGMADLGDVPDWLQPAQPATPDASAMDLNLDDAPDWLQEAASLTPAQTPGADSELEADTPAWLQGAEQPAGTADLPPWAQAEVPGPTDTVINFLASKETPDWLQQLRDQSQAPAEAEAEAAELTEAAAMLPGSETLPEAMPEPEATAPEAEEAPLMEAAAPPAMEESAVPLEPSLDDMSPDETMRWLEMLAAQQGAPADELFMTPAAEAPAAPEAPTASAPTPEAMDETPVPATAGGLDDWLRAAEAEYQVDGLADTAPHAKAEPAPLPDWLTAATETEAEATTEAEPEAPGMETPAWLAEIEAQGQALAEAPVVDEPLPTQAEASAEETLRLLEEQAALAEAKSVAAEGPDQLDTAEGEPDIDSMNADEAMAWLEKLAAQQGASADELLTAPEDRPDATPDWIVAAQQTEAETAEEAPALAPGLVPDWLAELKPADDSEAEQALEPATLPDWLKPPTDLVSETPVDQAAAEPELPGAVAPAGPDFDSMDAEAAMAWLEGLAAQQGANPAELLTAPEDRPAEAPAWVQAAEAAATPEPVMAAPEPEPVETTPPVMEAPPPAEPAAPETVVAEQAPVEPEPAQPPAATAPLGADVDRLARLSERLAAGRRAKEAEIEARFAQQRAEQEEARRLVWESMQAKKAAVESAIEAIEGTPPGADEPDAPAAPVAPAPRAPTVRARTGPLTPPAPRVVPPPLPAVPDESAWVPATPPRRAPAVSRYAGQAPETVLAEAQASLQQQDAAAAVAALDHLVSGGQMVDTVIAELEGAAAGEAAPVPLLRVLGDAYARSNRVDQALAAYRQALRKL